MIYEPKVRHARGFVRSTTRLDRVNDPTVIRILMPGLFRWSVPRLLLLVSLALPSWKRPKGGASPSPPLTMSAWVSSCLGFAGSARVGLSVFITQALHSSDSCTVEPPTSRGDPWPCPPPRPWMRRRWTACKPSPRQRRRLRAHKLVQDMLGFIISCLNWLALGGPVVCPPRARAGALLTDVQHEMCQNLERHLRYFLSAGPLEGQSLGRCEEKFTHLLRTVKELPCVQPDITDVDLNELVCALQREIDPYGHRAQPDLDKASYSTTPNLDLPKNRLAKGTSATAKPPRSPATLGHQRAGQGLEVHSSGSLGCLASRSSVAYKRVSADRIKWQCPPSFDPVPYLSDPLVKAIYLKPDTLKKPPESWPRLRPAHVNCSRHELLKLAHKWDQVGALQIIRAEGVDESELVGLFSIPKDREFDRLIINPTTINSRCSGYSNFTKLLAPGALLTQLHLNSDEVARFSADDLTEMYYTFVVSPAEAEWGFEKEK